MLPPADIRTPVIRWYPGTLASTRLQRAGMLLVLGVLLDAVAAAEEDGPPMDATAVAARHLQVVERSIALAETDRVQALGLLDQAAIQLDRMERLGREREELAREADAADPPAADGRLTAAAAELEPLPEDPDLETVFALLSRRPADLAQSRLVAIKTDPRAPRSLADTTGCRTRTLQSAWGPPTQTAIR